MRTEGRHSTMLKVGTLLAQCSGANNQISPNVQSMVFHQGLLILLARVCNGDPTHVIYQVSADISDLMTILGAAATELKCSNDSIQRSLLSMESW